MVFNSVDFLIFFPIVLFVYFLIPRKVRYIWLLITSYYFYMSWNPKYAILIAVSTVITYASGVLMGRLKTGNQETVKKKKKWIVAISFITNIGILFFFKYFDFALAYVNQVLDAFHIQMIHKPFDVLLPVGISFYTFQALSYTMDVYRGDMEPERNIFKYALFVSFFPQLVAGPIERSTNLMKQVQQVHTFHLWNYERITGGLALMLWGYFMKMVIADRLAILVDFVFGNYSQFGGVILLVAAIFFAFQIYCDFGSYSLIAMGSAKIMGFSLMENFNTPYFSQSIKEFWRRWHISLSGWFRDYLYIPLGGNRKGRGRKYLNLIITFLVSGLWHGANFTFIVWGGLHGLYQIIGDLMEPVRKRYIKKEILPYRLCRGIITFALVDFAWIFFRSNSLRDSALFIWNMIRYMDFSLLWNGSLYTLGLNHTEFWIAVISLVVLLIVDVIRYKKDMQLYEYLNTKMLPLRWGVYIFLIVAIYVFGIYGFAYDAAQFYYFQF